MIIVDGSAYFRENNIQLNYSSGEILGEEIFYNGEAKNIFVESNHLIALECSWNKFKKKVKLLNNSLEQTINDLNSIYFFQGLKDDEDIANQYIGYEKYHFYY